MTTHTLAPTHRILLRDISIGLAALATLGAAACSKPAAADAARFDPAMRPAERPAVSAASPIDAGRYLVKLGGCNDCHTPGYVQSNGKSPAEADWLTGSPLGYSGPWGTSYPANLRLVLASMDEAQFLDLAHKGEGRPPMPWPSLMAMSNSDLKAIYAYVRSLGPTGAPAPAALDPGVKPAGPFVKMTP
jgi:mono/diheme cytochrome c family protein